jgi:beta-glucosidase
MVRYVIAPSLAAAEEAWDPGVFVLHVGPNSRDTQSVELRWDA